MTGTTATTYTEAGIYYAEDRVIYVTDFNYSEAADAESEAMLLDTETFIDPNDYDPSIPAYVAPEIVEDEVLGNYSVDEQKMTSSSANAPPGNISPNLTWTRALKSRTADRLNMPNDANESQKKNMVTTSLNIWEVLYRKFGKKLGLNSFFRSTAVNDKVNGSKTSQHVTGEAMDLTLGSPFANIELFNYIKNNLVFDQLIYENSKHPPEDGPDWVHVSFNAGYKNKGQVFRMQNSKVKGNIVKQTFNKNNNLA